MNIKKITVASLILALLTALCAGMAIAEEQPVAVVQIPHEVARGNMLEVTLDGGDYYHVWIAPSDDDNPIGDDYWFAGESMGVGTAILEPGAYTLCASAYYASENGQEDVGGEEVTRVGFEVTENTALGQGDVLLALSGTDIAINASMRFSIYAPGAEMVFLDTNANHDDRWEGDSAMGQYTFSYDGNWRVSASAVYPDGTVATSETYTVNVSSVGNIGWSMLNVPAIVTAGQDVEITCSEPMNIDELDFDMIEYSLSVSWWNGEEDVFVLDETHHDASEPFIVEGDQLEAGRVYNVHYFVGTPHRAYVSYEDDYSFFAVEDVENYVDGRAWLTVNDQGNEAHVGVNEDFKVYIDAPGMTAARLYDGDELRDLREEGDWEQWQENGAVEYWRSHGFNRRAILYAEVCFDEDPDSEEAEWVLSNAVAVNVEWRGALAAPTATVQNSPVTRGYPLYVTVEDIPEGTEGISMDVENAVTGEWMGWWGETDGFIAYPTGGLQPGAYRGRVHTMANGKIEGNTYVYFTVLENDNNEIQLFVDPETAETHQTVSISAFAPGAQRVILYVGREEADARDGEWASVCRDFSHAGEYVVRAVALYEEDSQESVPQTITVTAEGDVVPPVIHCDDVPFGENLTFSFDASENADWYYAFVEDADGWDTIWETGAAPDETYEVPADLLKAGHTYRVNVHAGHRGYNYCDDNSVDVLVVADADERLSLTIDGQDQDATLTVNGDYTAILESEGATAVRFYNGDGFEDHNPGYDEFGFGQGYRGEYRVYFIASFDEDPWAEDAQWVMSNIVTLHVEGEGALGDIDFSYPETVERGDDLVVTINSLMDHGEWYGAEIIAWDEEGDHWLGYHHWDEETRQITLPTTRLEPGDYRLFVSSAAVGWDSTWSEVWFTVVPSEQRRVTLEMNKDYAVTLEDVGIYIYAPGADSIELREGEDGVRDQCEGDSYAGEHSWGHSGEVDIWAVAYYGENQLESEHYTLNIDNPSGDLETPWFALAPVLMPGRDVTIEAGVENAGSYGIRVWDVQTDESIFDEGWDASEYPGGITVSADQFELYRTYRASVYVNAYGMNDNYFEREFTTAEDYMGDTILTVNGERDSVEIPCNEEFQVSIEAYSDITAFRYYNGDDWWDWDSDLNNMTFTDGRGNAGEYDLYAMVYGGDLEAEYYDPMQCFWAAPVHVTFTAEGDLDVPEFDMPESVTRGDDLVLENIGDFGVGEWYGATIHRMDGEEVVGYVHWNEDERTITLPTITLEPGDYRVRVYNSAVNYQSNQVERDFTVEDLEEGQSVFRLSKDEITTYEDVTVQAYVPGAAWINLWVRDNQNNDYDGDSFIDRLSFNTSGVYEIHLFAHFYDDEDNETIEELGPKTVTVTSSGALAKARVYTPTLALENTDITVGFDGVEGAEHYYVDLFCVEIEGHPLDEWEFITGFETDEPGEFTFSARNFSANRVYRFCVDAWTPGLDFSTSEKRFIVHRDSYYTEPVLTVNGETSELTVQANENVEVCLNTPGATALKVLRGDHWEYYYTRDDIPFYLEWDFESGDYTIIAQASYDGFDGGEDFDPDNIDYESLNWQWPTNGVSLHVEANGRLDAPELSADGSVARGLPLNVNIGEVENGEWYDLRIFDVHEDGWYEELYYHRYMHGGEVEAPTADLEPGGNYAVGVYAGATGWDGNGSRDVPFAVTDYVSGVNFSVSPAQVLTNEDFTLSGYVPEAVGLRILENDEEVWSSESDSFVENWSRGSAGESVFALEYTFDGEDWQRCQDEYPVTVTSNGRLDDPWIEIEPTVVEAGWQTIYITVHGVENGENYWFHLEDERGEWLWDTGISPDLPRAVSTDFLSGAEYKVCADVGARGFDNGHSEARFVSVGIPEDLITLSVNGETESIEAQVNENLAIRVEVPTDATRVKLYTGEDYWRYDPEDYPDGVILDSRSYGWENNFTLYAKYTTNDIYEDTDENDLNWSHNSNVVTVTTTAEGELDELETSMPASVVRGNPLEIQVTAPTEHVADYGASMHRVDDEGYGSDYYRSYSDSGWIYIPTADLEAGEYWVYIDANGEPGWLNRGVRRLVEVVEPEEGEACFTIDKTEILTNEEYTISVYAPGADGIRILEDGRWRDERGGDSSVWRWSEGRSDEFVLTAEAYYGEQDEWVGIEKGISMSVTAPYGELDAPEANLPAILAPDTALTFTVSGVENAENYWFDLEDDYGEHLGHWDNIVNRPITVRADRFETGRRYRLSVHAGALGYLNADREYFFVVSGDPQQSIYLTVNGSDENQTVQVMEDVVLKVNVPESVTGVRVYFANDCWNVRADEFQGGVFWRTDHFRDHGTYPTYAVVTFDEIDDWTDWNELNWSYPGNVVTLTATTKGKVNTPSYTTVDSVVRGEMLEIQIHDPDPRAEYYDAILEAWDYGISTDWAVADENFIIRVPTAGLVPGIPYRLEVDANGAPGWETARADQMIEVLEPEGGDIRFTLDKTDVITGEPYSFGVYAPGAREVQVLRNNGVDGSDWSEGDSLTRRWEDDRPDEFVLTAQALYDGSDEWVTAETSYTVRVTAPNGKLDAPQVSASAVINAGDSLTFIVGGVDNGERYWFDLHDETDDLNMNGDVVPGVPTTLPAELFEPGRLYRLYVHVSAKGYETVDTDRSVLVAGSVDESIILAVNGSTQAPLEALKVNEMFDVDLQLPEDVTGVRLFVGNDEWRYDRNDIGADWKIHDVISWWNDEPAAAYARYTRDGISDDTDWNELSWSDTSNIISLTFIKDGDVAEPEVEFNDPVTRGDVLEVRVLNVDGHADSYNACLFSEDTGEGFDWYDMEDDNVIRIPTARTPAGSYRLEVNANGIEGWHNSSLRTNVSIVEPADGEIRFLIDKTELLTSENFNISVYAPGASRIRILDEEGERDWEDGDSFERSWSDGHSNTYTLFAEAYYEETDEWVQAEASYDMVFTAPYGQLDALQVDMPAVISAGDPLTFKVYPVENGEHYWVDLHDQYGSWIDGWDVVAGEPFTIAGDFFEANQTYRLSVHVSALGYENSDEEFRFLVSGDVDGSITLTINGSDQDQTFPVNHRFDVQIQLPEGATAARLFWGDDCWDYDRNAIDDTWKVNDNASRGEVGPLPVYARYTMDEYNEDTDWNELNWSAISNVISLTLTSNGQVPEPDAEFATEVTRGELLEIRVLRAEEHVEAYDASIEDENTGHWTDWYQADGEGVIHVPTAVLEPGSYWLHVDANGEEGWQSNGIRVRINILEPADGEIRFLIDKTELLTSENYTLSVYAPGASRIRILDEDGERDWEDGDSFERKWSDSHSNTYTLFAEAYYAETDEWVQAGTSYDMVFTAPYGLLDEPDIEIPGQISLGDQLPVTVGGVEHAENLWVELRKDNGEWIDSWDVGFGDTLWLDADWFEAGRTYNVSVHLSALGYEGWDADYSVLVLGEPDGSVTLRINDSTEDASLLVNEPFDIRIDLPQEATYAKLNIGDGYWSFSQEDMDNGVITRPDFCYNQWGEYPVFVTYTTETMDEETGWSDLHWSGNSNVINLTLAKLDDIPVPVVEMPDVVREGDVIHVKATNLSEYSSSYDAGIVCGTGLWPNEDQWYSLDENGEADVPTEGIETGPCTMVIISHGLPGYQEHTAEVPFTLLQMPEPVALEIAEAEVPIFGDMEFTVTTSEDPASITLIVDDAAVNSWSEDDLTGTENTGAYRMTETGEHTVCVEVTYIDGLTGRSEAQTVTVVSQGEAPALAYDLCPSTFPDWGLRIYYWDNITEDTEVEAWYNGNPFTVSFWDESASLTYYDEENPLPLGIVEITIVNEQVGYDRHEETARVLVADPDKVFNLPESLKEIKAEAFAGIKAEMVVVPDGCTSIGSKAFAGCSGLARIIIPESVTYIAPDAFQGCEYLAVECLYGSYAEQYCFDNGVYCDGYGE